MSAPSAANPSAPAHVRVPQGDEPVLATSGLTKTFRGPSGPVVAVDNVSVNFMAAQVTAIVGESGSGKSTLARMLLRLLPVTSGTITYSGGDVTHIHGRQLRHYWSQVQAVFQDPFASFNQFFTVGDVLRRSLKLVNGGTESREARIERCLGYVGLKPADCLAKFPHQLSGGQRQRVMIARALMMDPRVLIADEATSMLDASLRVGVLNELRELRVKLNQSVLFITHDIGQACYLADRVVVMQHGRLVEQGSTDQVIFEPQQDYTKRLLADVPSLKRSFR
jgi:peptide/nickel transport system ATP-binding protein